jgi:hypothetical protein
VSGVTESARGATESVSGVTESVSGVTELEALAALEGAPCPA